jgi:tyrosinase
MMKLSRRHLVAGGLAGAGATIFPGLIKEANAATSIRYNLASANGQIMLKKYAQAVKIMMALPPSDPRSWTFQWFTHAVPTNTTKAAALTQIFGSGSSPQKALATAMWNTCQGHFGAAGEPYFLPWHRMFVCYFEEIIRALLKDPKFSLPYWNYSVPAGYPIPKEFRMQNDPLWGPLFRPDRKSVVNAGQPIFNGNPGGTASDLSTAPAMAQTSYLPVGVVQGFNQTLDFGLHGNVHVYVGTTVGMGRIPWAANDPIFWMHHCNIDRIWTSWNVGHPNPNTAAWQNKVFVFAGPDGKEVKPVVKDYTNTKKCNYTYDQLISSAMLVAAAQAAPSPAAAAPVAPAVTVAKSQSGPVALSAAAPVRVNLQGTAPPAPSAAAPTPSAAAASPLSAKLSALPESRRLYLVLSDIKAEDQPDAVYRVYLDLPGDGAPSDPVNSHYVGTFNFFAAVPHGDDHSDHGTRSLSFDITEMAANLDAKGLLKTQAAVTIVPSNEPAANAKPVVGDISFVEQ